MVQATFQSASSLLAAELCPLETYLISSLKPAKSGIFSSLTKETEGEGD